VLGALFPDVDTAFGRHRKTLHSLPVLGIFLAYPIVFGNLQYVWIGVLTHYALDVIGSRRGIALFHPLSDTEYGMPTGVTTSSKYADLVTVIVTAVELGLLGAPHLRRDPRSRYLGGRPSGGGCRARNLRTQSGLRNGSCVTSAGSRRASRSRRSRR